MRLNGRQNAIPLLRADNPDSPEEEIVEMMLFKDLSEAPSDTRNHIRVCCQSIEGLCYMAAMETGPLKGWMAFRCLQFTKYMDAEHARGFKPQPRDTKEKILKELNLLFDNWEEWC